MAAYDEAHGPGRRQAAAATNAALAVLAPAAFGASGASGASAGSEKMEQEQLEEEEEEEEGSPLAQSSLPTRCVRLALGRGCAVAVTEDWGSGLGAEYRAIGNPAGPPLPTPSDAARIAEALRSE